MTNTYADQRAEVGHFHLDRTVEAIRPFLMRHNGGCMLMDYTQQSDSSCVEPFRKDSRLKGLRVLPCCTVRSFAAFLEEREEFSGQIFLVLDSTYPGRWLAWIDLGDEDNPAHEIGPIMPEQLLRLLKDPENDYLPKAIADCFQEEVSRCSAKLLEGYRDSILLQGELSKIFGKLGFDKDGGRQ